MTTSTLAPSLNPSSVEQRSTQLLGYFRATLLPHLLSVAIIIGFAIRLDTEGLNYIVVLISNNLVLSVWAYWEARRGNLSRSILLHSSGLIIIMLGLLAFGNTFYAIVCAMAFLPVMMAMPYVSDRGVLTTSLVTVCVMVFGAIITMNEVTLLQSGFPAVAERWATASTVILLVVISSLTLWYNAKLLNDTVTETERANVELRELEHSLEQEVEARTAELVDTNNELEKARDEAIKADAQTTHFLSSMSHELRTPLNAVIGFSELLQQKYFGDLNDKQDEYVGDIKDSAKHLLLLINDILDLSKVESGHFELRKQAFDYDAMIDSALVLVTNRAEKHGIGLSTDIPQAIGLVNADERKIKQVLINLLTNAVKFTPAGGNIVVGVTQHDDTIETYVSDTGQGISADDQKRIFEDFQQASDNRPDTEGTGLGLSLSRRIIEMHDGEIGVSSQPGQGACFSFTIPRGLTSSGERNGE